MVYVRFSKRALNTYDYFLINYYYNNLSVVGCVIIIMEKNTIYFVSMVLFYKHLQTIISINVFNIT